MHPEIAELRGRIKYSPMAAGRIGDTLTSTASAVMSIFDVPDPGKAALVHQRLTDPDLRMILEKSYACVALLVGSELDTNTPGERGLGRTTTAVPRFGARFATALTEDLARGIGPLMEDLCIAGFGAGAAYDVLLRTEPTPLRHRELDELTWQWVSRCIGTWSDWSNSALSLADASGAPHASRLMAIAENAGMTKGLRGKSKREDIQKTCFMLSAAGVQLFVAHTPAADSWFGRS